MQVKAHRCRAFGPPVPPPAGLHRQRWALGTVCFPTKTSPPRAEIPLGTPAPPSAPLRTLLPRDGEPLWTSAFVDSGLWIWTSLWVPAMPIEQTPGPGRSASSYITNGLIKPKRLFNQCCLIQETAMGPIPAPMFCFPAPDGPSLADRGPYPPSRTPQSRSATSALRTMDLTPPEQRGALDAQDTASTSSPAAPTAPAPDSPPRSLAFDSTPACPRGAFIPPVQSSLCGLMCLKILTSDFTNEGHSPEGTSRPSPKALGIGRFRTQCRYGCCLSTAQQSIPSECQRQATRSSNGFARRMPM